MRTTSPTHPTRRSGVTAAALLLATLLGGCDTLDRALEVETPSRLPASNLDDPAQAELLVRSAQADFECAYASYIVAGGLVAGELQDGTQTAARWNYDRRSITPDQANYATNDCEGVGMYTPLSTARFSADDAVARLEAFADEQVEGRTALIARASNFAGLSLVLLGEAFCSAALDVGPELTSEQLFTEAETRFTEALAAAQAVGDEELTVLAHHGRARARLNLGRLADAAADAALVPATFQFDATYDETNERRYNRVFDQNNQNILVTVAPSYRDVSFAEVADPRVPVKDSGRRSSDQNTSLWVQQKYAGLATSIPIARAAEAQLILAEAAGGATAVGIINQLHLAAGLPPFAGGTAEEIQAQIVEERRRELFLEGRRLGDIRRYGLSYEPAPGLSYPVAAQSTKGGTYVDIPGKCLPLPDVERLNNPNIPDVAGG